MNTGKRDNDALGGDFDRLTDAYRDLPEAEPPQEVDLAVLRHARAPSRHAARPWNFGWVHVLSTAAVLVLGIAVVRHLPDEAVRDPLRVAKPPSGKLRDTASEFVPLQPNAAREAEKRTATVPAAAAEFQARRADADAPANRQAAPAAEPAADEAMMAAEAIAEEQEVGQREVRAAQTLESDAVDKEETGGAAAVRSDPETWLAQIVAMKQRGDEAWREELAAFVEAWPEYPLPDALDD